MFDQFLAYADNNKNHLKSFQLKVKVKKWEVKVKVKKLKFIYHPTRIKPNVNTIIGNIVGFPSHASSQRTVSTDCTISVNSYLTHSHSTQGIAGKS